MPYLTNTVFVARPRPAVFEVATTGGHWGRWHPATQAVRGTTGHPVEVGEQIVEDMRLAGRAVTITWTCTERDPPGHLVMEGQGDGRTTARLVYTFAEQDGGTRISRELTYEMPALSAARGETLVVHRAMREQSAQAVENLKALLETEIPAPGTIEPA